VSTAKLNIWVTKVGDPCRIDDSVQWFVHILHCNGEILQWCDKKYANLPTKCGHLEVEIPPGCYMVVATWSPGAGTTVPTSLGNHISHLQIIRANCGDHLCVTLFPPTFHWCGVWWLVALREAMGGTLLPREAQPAAKQAIEAVDALMKQIPADPLAERMLQIEQQTQAKGRKTKK
jgi:hypothetical protein